MFVAYFGCGTVGVFPCAVVTSLLCRNVVTMLLITHSVNDHTNTHTHRQSHRNRAAGRFPRKSPPASTRSCSPHRPSHIGYRSESSELWRRNRTKVGIHCLAVCIIYQFNYFGLVIVNLRSTSEQTAHKRNWRHTLIRKQSVPTCGVWHLYPHVCRYTVWYPNICSPEDCSSFGVRSGLGASVLSVCLWVCARLPIAVVDNVGAQITLRKLVHAIA